jgi:HD-GYP domain-containing protein (c-di-GMP phosphodiesterase class II)
MLSEKKTLAKVMKLGAEIAEVKDVDVLLERILSEARQLIRADAGSIYVKEGSTLKFTYTQNDTLQKLLPAGKKLIYSTFSIPINNQSISGYVANTGDMLNLSDVYKLPPGLPYSFNKSYDNLSGYRTRSMLTFPLKTSRGDTVGVLQLINGKSDGGKIVPFRQKDQPLVRYFAHMAAAAIERAQMTRTMILRTIKMAELRDPKETGAHVNRVASYAVIIYEAWAGKKGFAPEEIEKNRDILRMAAMLHDVGKVAISDVILQKPAQLNDEERAAMKQHSFLGAKLFAEQYSDFDEAAAVVALNHHERWDGTGYPGHVNPYDGTVMRGYANADGTPRPKKGEEIPLFARFVALADVYDALRSHRVYKEQWDETHILDELKNDSGTHFDPEIVESFFTCLDVIHSVAERYPDR